jgi:hypothetical protein
VSPVKYELRFYIPEDDILHSDRREIVKSNMDLRMIHLGRCSCSLACALLGWKGSAGCIAAPCVTFACIVGTGALGGSADRAGTGTAVICFAPLHSAVHSRHKRSAAGPSIVLQSEGRGFDEIITLFNSPNRPSRNIALGWTQPLTGMSTRDR